MIIKWLLHEEVKVYRSLAATDSDSDSEKTFCYDSDSDSDSEKNIFADSDSDSDSVGVGVKIGFRSTPQVSSERQCTLAIKIVDLSTPKSMKQT